MNTGSGKDPSKCMWFVVAVVSQAYPGNADICPGFPPPQAALRTESDAVYIDIVTKYLMSFLNCDWQNEMRRTIFVYEKGLFFEIQHE